MIFEKFEPFPLKCKKNAEKTWIWCPLRNKWLILTQEEWVRQQWIQYFLKQNYPKGWMIVEYTLNYQNKKNIRLDLALTKENQELLLLAEFKKYDYSIGMKDLEQILRYANVLPTDYLMISNFFHTYLWDKNFNQWKTL